jgi:hypothetical protein
MLHCSNVNPGNFGKLPELKSPLLAQRGRRFFATQKFERVAPISSEQKSLDGSPYKFLAG